MAKERRCPKGETRLCAAEASEQECIERYQGCWMTLSMAWMKRAISASEL